LFRAKHSIVLEAGSCNGICKRCNRPACCYACVANDCLQGLLEQAQMVQEWELQAVVQQVQVLQSVLDQAEIAQDWASSALEAVLQMVQ
jgi:hypothetical protein